MFNNNSVSKSKKRISLMDNDKHVYCVDCEYFRLCDEGMPYCYFEDRCDITDYEDSKAVKYKPYFKQKREAF